MKPGNVEDLYRLSPVQEGMLFHVLHDGASAPYFEQFVMPYGRNLDLDRLERVWQTVLDRHPILRTAFFWQEVERPVQVVHRRVSLPFEHLDWRGLSAAEREERLRRFLEDDRARGFSLERAPLLRLAAIRWDEESIRIVWSYHHLLLDGWSASLLLQEVAELYNAGIARGEAPPPAPRRPFHDYITWLKQQDLSAAEAYWQRVLDGFVPAVLGIDRAPGRLAPADSNEEIELALSPALTESVDLFARQHRLTLYTVVEAAWALTLARYSSARDVVFGSTVSGRPASLPGAESMIGCFINTLPVRTRVSFDQPLLSWLRELQAGQVELRRYEHSPLVEIRRWSGLPAGTPLFESILVYESFAGSGRNRTRGVQGFQRTNFPLTTVAWPGRELVLQARYDTGRFAAEAVHGLLAHLAMLLEALASANAGTRLGDLLALSPAAEEEAGYRAAYPLHRCLHELLAEQVERTPDAIAVLFAEESLTYRELDRRANRLAHHLLRLGIGPEARVGIAMERSAELVVALLGVLKAGAAYVPLDPSYPGERLATMAEDAFGGADGIARPVVLTQERLATRLPAQILASGARVIALDAGWEALAAEPDTSPPLRITAGGLAYVIFTSGSTGRPKGAMNTHRGIVNRLLWMQEAYGLGTDDCVLQKTPFSFDVSVWEFFWPLLTGARLVLAVPGGHRDPAYLVRLISERSVTTLHFVPSMLQAFLEEPGLEGLGSLRRVLASGEALAPALAARFFSRLPSGVELHNLYGPTEAAVDVTAWPCERDGSSVPIGRPVSNTQIHLLDVDLLPAPPGVPGELYIGGVQVGRGYLGRPDLTAERFVPDPSGGPGERLYRTGDLARRRPDGAFEYLGRIDFQVKIRGFRIELGEIEAALQRHPAVREAVVLAREDEPGDRRLVGYVVLDPTDRTDPTDPTDQKPALSSWLREKLPEHMVPAAFVALAALPLSPNGKVDRKALPAPGSASRPADAFVAPRNSLEEALARIWAAVLRLEQVGIDDDFFALGGHSLLATQVVARIQRELGLAPPVNWIFERPTVRGLAERTGLARPELPALRPSGRREGEPVPSSFAQEGLWLLDRLAHGSAGYNIPLSLRLGGRLNAAALAASLREIVRRHAVLRTRFAAIDDVPHQIVEPVPGLLLPVVELSGLRERVREAEARRLAVVAVLHPFDLARGPMLRAVLLRLGAADHIVLLAMHHIASDGWSKDVLVREMVLLYDAFSQGRPSPLSELPVQYADYAAWQRQWLQGEVLSRHLAYWRQQLAGAPAVLPLRTDRPRPAVRTSRGGQIAVALPAELRDRLAELGREERCTLFMTLLAGYTILLHQWSGGAERVVVGSPISYRNWPEVEDLIGFFANVLVYHTSLEGDPTFRELLSRVRRMVLDSLTHQHVPFERLVEELRPERSLSHNPLFQVTFGFMAAGAVSAPSPGEVGLVVDPFGLEGTAAQVDLNVHLTDTPQGVIGTLRFSSDLFDEATVASRWDQLRFLLGEVEREPDLRLSELRPRLAAAERRLWARKREELEEASSRSFKDRRRRAVMAVAEVAGGSPVQEG